MSQPSPTPAGAKRAPKKGASRAEAAKHFGIDPTSVRDWERRGWVVRYQDRSIDLDATGIRVDANRDPSRGGKPDRGHGATPPTYAPPSTDDPTTSETDLPEAPPDDLKLPPGMTAATALALKNYWQAIKARNEALQAEGKLIPVADAQRAWVDIITAAKANLEGVPILCADKVIGLKDVREIREVIRIEITKALRGIPNDAPATG